MKITQRAGRHQQSKSFANQNDAVINAAKQIPAQRKENKTGMPDNLKSGLENLSGYDLSHVRVHFNSSKPAQLNALAYAQGSQVHIGPGQQKHLPHEGWHIVQQMQGRVKPTMETKTGTKINNDAGLESEADKMGQKALMQLKKDKNAHEKGCGCSACHSIQRKTNGMAANTGTGIVQKASKCGRCGRSLPKGTPDGTICQSCQSEQQSNTNRGRGENRNQSFGGETHTKGSKKGNTGRTAGQSHR